MMRRLVTGLLAAAALTSTLAAQEPRRMPPPPAEPPSVGLSREATQLLEKVAETYGKAAALRDAITIRTGGQATTLELAFEGSNAFFQAPGMKLTALDGRFLVESDDITDKYLETALQNDLPTTMAQVFGAGANLPFHYLMRSRPPAHVAAGRMDVYVHSFGLGGFRNPVFAGLESARSEDGRSMRVLRFSGSIGEMSVHIAAESNLVEAVIIENQPPPGIVATAGTVTITMKPKVSDRLEEPIAFEPGMRQAVDSIAHLAPPRPEPVRVGAEAPPFTMKTLTGETVDLAELRGSMVVLDFWATWCGPCIRGLPMLDEFTKWAAQSDHPIEVYAVNVWERVDQAARQKHVESFWRRLGHSMPVLVDQDDSVVKAYGFNSIPSLVVIGPDGRVMRVHSGLMRNLVEVLQGDVRKAFAASP